MPFKPTATPIRVTTHYFANRWQVDGHGTKCDIRGMRTEVYYRETRAESGTLRITVMSRVGWVSKRWTPAEINWSWSEVHADEAAEFAKALAWAVKEARKFDLYTKALNLKLQDEEVEPEPASV